jgi:hypothetical protein
MLESIKKIKIILNLFDVLEQDGRGNPSWLPLNCIIILWAMVGVGLVPTREWLKDVWKIRVTTRVTPTVQIMKATVI